MDGIHAILIVCSIRNRFSREEEDTIQAFQDLFGDNIANYIILIFTGGDDFPDKDDPLANYLGPNCPKAFQNVLHLCRGRVVLFDHKTKDETKRAKQVEQLLFHVNTVGKESCGQPYSNEYFIQLKEVKSLKGSSEKESSEKHEELLKRITEMVELKLTVKIQKLEKQLADDQAINKSTTENFRLQENLDRTLKVAEELRNRAESSKCTIL